VCLLSQTLHTFKGNFRAFKILIAAGYNGVNIDWKEVDPKNAASLSPAGRLPVLETPEGEL
jgi:glutathione S-transferase